MMASPAPIADRPGLARTADPAVGRKGQVDPQTRLPWATGDADDIALAWDNGTLKLVAPRVVAGPPSAESLALCHLLSGLPDPYAIDPEMVDAFVGGLLAGAP